MYTCKICNNSDGNKSYIAREMMFNIGESFEYFECAECGCLQIKEIPENLERFYPENYLFFQQAHSLKDDSIKAFLKHQRAKYCLSGNNIFSGLLAKIFGIPEYYAWFNKTGTGFNAKILDVGCGAGNLLINLRKEGFTNLTGADSFIKKDIFYENGIKIFKKELSEIKEQFDLIMLIHSFEHMPEPLNTLKELYRLLKPESYILLRMPVAGAFAWRTYGVSWVQIDAPRHFFLHTKKSINILAEQTGFQVADEVFDSTDFQFWGSEQYLKNIPYMDGRSYAMNPEKSIFTKKQINIFKNKALELNKNQDGDSACFYLYKK